MVIEGEILDFVKDFEGRAAALQSREETERLSFVNGARRMDVWYPRT